MAPAAAHNAVAGAETRAGASQPRSEQTLVVTTTDDITDPGDGLLSLREAIVAADAHPSPSTIVLAAGATYGLTDCSLHSGLLWAIDGPALTIEGNGATVQQTCDGGAVLRYTGGETLNVRDVTITGGRQGASCCGGGIGVTGTFVGQRIQVIGNQTDNDSGGGGLFIDGDATVVDSLIADNRSKGGGGGLRVTASASIERSSVLGNHSDSSGGGALLDSGGMVRDSTFADNTAHNSHEISGFGPVDLRSTTVVGTLPSGTHVNATSLTFENAVVAVPSTAIGCGGSSKSSLGGNYSTDASCAAGDEDATNGAEPRLRVPFRNGGRTPTMYPAVTSPLLDASPIAVACGTTDQRGVDRPQGSAVDIGSVEVEPCGGRLDDVAADHPFCWEVGWLLDAEVTTGFGDGTYRPASAVTRQAMAAFMYRLAGSPMFAAPAEPTFTDVDPTHPFHTEIEWLADAGIAGGFPDGTYGATAAVSRQAMAAFMYRLADGWV
ncbi:MAG: S-layer homology domain-containing protein [Acidimicrobiia bacterium]|nr:S-layer homology domain-containing protein [Acidimicrobiia bacterium]